MQVGIKTTASAVSLRLLTPAQSSADSLPKALRLILERIAGSTQLSLSQKRSFAEAIKSAFEAGNGKLVAKLMMLVAQAEAQNMQVSGQYSKHSVEDILPKKPTDIASATVDTTSLLSGQDRMRQLLFS